MTVYNWLCLLGVPTIVGIAFKYLYNVTKKNHEDTMALKLGVQALLRSKMIEYYSEWRRAEAVPISVKNSYENCWKQYEKLGDNGVMEDMHDKFISLPIAEQDL